jgi:hypothetical protein
METPEDVPERSEHPKVEQAESCDVAPRRTLPGQLESLGLFCHFVRLRSYIITMVQTAEPWPGHNLRIRSLRGNGPEVGRVFLEPKVSTVIAADVNDSGAMEQALMMRLL